MMNLAILKLIIHNKLKKHYAEEKRKITITESKENLPEITHESKAFLKIEISKNESLFLSILKKAEV